MNDSNSGCICDLLDGLRPVEWARNAGDRTHFDLTWQHIRNPNPTTITWDLIVS